MDLAAGTGQEWGRQERAMPASHSLTKPREQSE